MGAVKRGARFEICYSQALDPSADARQRANFIGNVLSLLRATRGRGIVVSSGARSSIALRGPADVINLLAVWGLGPERGTEALGAGARAVVVNEGIKRRGFRGVVDIVRPAVEDETAAAARKEEADKGRAEKGQKQKGQLQGLKRKEESSTSTSEGQGQGTISKRKAKKMRMEALQATGAA